MPIQTMNQSLDTRFIEMAQITSCLSRLLSLDKGLGVDRSESVNDDFTTDGLNRIHDYSYTSRIELFK